MKVSKILTVDQLDEIGVLIHIKPVFRTKTSATIMFLNN